MDPTTPALLLATEGAPEVSLEPGEALIDEGVGPACLYVLVTGAMRVRKGDVAVATIATPGACIGEIALLLGVEPTATVEAMERTVVRRIEHPDDLQRDHPEVTLALARMLAQRLNTVTAYLADLRHQYAGTGTSLELVGDVLDSLLHQPRKAATGSARDPDPLY
jgi:CRP/FNR family cyclic AMP-dependent transcriptional regulator